MRIERTNALFALAAIIIIAGCNNNDKTMSTETKLNEDHITYTLDSVDMSGYIVYDENVKGRRPVVLVVPEWWGFTDYPKMRARELAKLGYLAMAIDLYGNGVSTTSPDTAGKLAGPFYQDPQMAKARIDAAIARIRSHAMADSNKIAAVGYCFGGGMLLNTVRLGDELDGVVSFHGSLLGTPANKDLLRSKILVCHGEADPLVPPADVAQFKKQMDSINADYKFVSYPGALHAFTNPAATELGKKYNMPIAYNAAADTASWNEMKAFLGGVFQK